MKFGITGYLDRLPLLKSIGFDFVEPAASTVWEMEDKAFMDLEQRITENGLPALAFNMFFPSFIKTTGDNVDNEKITSFLHKCLGRCQKLGAKTIVYGSGGSRRVPDGFPFSRAWQQLVDFFKLAGDIADQYDITIVIEPLYKNNCNIIHTVAEGLRMCREANSPRIRLLADNFHMIHENEDPDIMLEAGVTYLHHIHIRDIDQGFPLEKDRPYFERFMSVLLKTGYDRTISYEVSTPNATLEEFEKTARNSLAFIKSML